MSNAGPSARAADSTSDSSTLTPTLMLAANTIGISRAESRRAAPSARHRVRSCRPPRRPAWRAHAARCASVPSGRVKSISTSARASAASTSVATRMPVTRPQAFARVAADGGAAGDVERGGRVQPGLRQHRLDQRLAHAAAGAGDRDPDVGHRQGAGVAAGSSIFLNKSMILPMKPASCPYGSSGSERVAATRLRSCDGLRHLVAFPARQHVVLEVHGELAMLAHAAAALELVDVVPAVVAERADDERRAERQPHLLLGLPDLQPVDHVLRQVVALVDVEPVDAELRDQRHEGVEGLA